MAINLSTYFTAVGKFLNAGNQLITAASNVRDEIEDAIQALSTTPGIDFEPVRANVEPTLQSFLDSVPGWIESSVAEAVRRYTIETVEADNPQQAKTAQLAIREVIRQIIAAGQDLKGPSTVSATVSADGGNTGNGLFSASAKIDDGRASIFQFPETLTAECVSVAADKSATFRLRGQNNVGSLSWDWPQGSGIANQIQAYVGASPENLIPNGTFETADDSDPTLPAGWVRGSVSSLAQLTDVEEQTVVISGSPSGGSYVLHWTNADSDQQTTVPLAYNASEADVQDALRGLIGLELVTVATTGTSPNFTHTITFTGVAKPAELTSTDAFAGGGSLAHATTTAGGEADRGGRSLNYIGDGANAISLYVPVVLQPNTAYLAGVYYLHDTAGYLFRFRLLDGIGGSVIADDQGNDNTNSNLTAGAPSVFEIERTIFITPAVLPEIVYFHLEMQSVMAGADNIWFNEAFLIPATEIYTGGPFVAGFVSNEPFIVGDRFTFPVACNTTNTSNGALHRWLNRIFQLRQNRLYFPWTTGTPDFDDTLIS